MALVKCRECGGQVSDHARTCPQCGAPVIATIKREQKALFVSLAVRIIVALAVGVIVWFAVGHIFYKAMAPLRRIEQRQQQH